MCSHYLCVWWEELASAHTVVQHVVLCWELSFGEVHFGYKIQYQQIALKLLLFLCVLGE